jgi:uncharacterized protein
MADDHLIRDVGELRATVGEPIPRVIQKDVNGVAQLTREPALLELGEVDGRQPWFVVDVTVRQVFSHCSTAFLRSQLWQPELWPDPDSVRSPSRTIAERAQAEARPERDVRQDVEREYEPELY